LMLPSSWASAAATSTGRSGMDGEPFAGVTCRLRRKGVSHTRLI
jgi:hypothetical protein